MEGMDWTEFSNVFGTVGPTVVALAVVILNRRDRLADKVNALVERLAAVETHLAGIDRRLEGTETRLGQG